MPNNWKTFKLSEVIKIIGGGTPKTSEANYWNGNIPWLSVKDFQGERKFVYETEKNITEEGLKKSSTKLLPKDAIIISARGTVGELGVLAKEMTFNQSCYGILPNDNIDNEYLYYLLKQKVNEIQSLSYGSVFDTITTKTFEGLNVKFSENITEQQSIAQILSTIDDKIENNLAINKTLEEMAMALYKHWFVDSVNDDWEKFYLKDLIEIKGGFSYKGKFIGKGDSLLLGMGCVSYNERFVSSGARLYSGECNVSNYVEPGEIVLATRQQSDNLPILGQPARIPKSLLGNKIIVGTNLYRVINKSNMSNSLLFQLLKSKEYGEHVLANASGTTVRMITKDVIELFELALPSQHLIHEYDEKISSISENIEQNTIENQTLTQLRDTLLPKLISGEVRLKEFRKN